jgi:hypothetical protein
VQAASGQAACQLTAPAPDLKHMITAADPRSPASLVDEFAGIGRAVPVVLGRDLIKYCAVTTGGPSWQTCHTGASVMGGNLSHVACRGAAGALPDMTARFGAMADEPQPSSPGGPASPDPAVNARRALERLGEAECMELLADAGMGRLVFNSRYGLTALPSGNHAHLSCAFNCPTGGAPAVSDPN